MTLPRSCSAPLIEDVRPVLAGQHAGCTSRSGRLVVITGTRPIVDLHRRPAARDRRRGRTGSGRSAPTARPGYPKLGVLNSYAPSSPSRPPRRPRADCTWCVGWSQPTFRAKIWRWQRPPRKNPSQNGEKATQRTCPQPRCHRT